MIMSDYTPPPWAEAPSNSISKQWSLSEIKNGVEMAVHALQRPSTTIGRQGDIEALHPSLSRFHARIAFDGSGTPWLRDLQSAHGVTVNKKPLPPASIGKDESNSRAAGSRGVIIYPGDLIQLGASTRIYCLDGPEEQGRGARPPVPASRERPKIAVTRRDFDGDDEEEAEEPQILSDATVPFNHTKEWDRIKSFRYKRDNLQTESQRIRAKADMGDELTEGQQRQLQRNDSRLQKMEDQIQAAEESLWQKVFGKRSQSTSRIQRSHGATADDDEVDDLYDEASRQGESAQGVLQSGEQQTEESLRQEWDRLCHQRQEVTADLHTTEEKANAAQKRISTAEETFFAENELKLALETHRGVETRLKSLDDQLDEVEKLMQVVNPKVALRDRTIDPRQQQPPPPKAKTIDSKPQEKLLPPEDSSTTMGPPHQRQQGSAPPATSSMLPPPPRKQASDMLPPPPRKRPTVSCPPNLQESTESSLPPTNHWMKAKDDRNNDRTTQHSNKRAKRPAAMPKTEQEPKDSSQFDTWQAPADQDGSGRTKLNEKFAGRY